MPREGEITRRVLLAAAAVLMLVSGPEAQRPDRDVQIPEAAERAILDALAAYGAGDDAAPFRWLTNATDRSRLRHLEKVLLEERPRWTRAKALFGLEVAAALPELELIRTPHVLSAALTFMVSRPAAFGALPHEDAFELRWHETALALAQRMQQYWLQQQMLDVIVPRLEHAHTRGGRVESRVPLARAVAAAGLCCWRPLPGEIIQLVSGPSRAMGLQEAVALYEAAAAIPSLRTEALIRGAVFLQTIERDAEALEWFARVPPHDDPALGYMQHLVLARLLEKRSRTSDAVRSYRRALDVEPRSQTAAIGLAAALLRAGSVEEAASVAARAGTMPEGPVLYHSTFRHADARFVPQWLAELRRLR